MALLCAAVAIIIQQRYNEVKKEGFALYRIRNASIEDLPRILNIYAYARDFMARNGNPNQWGKTNPPEAQLRLDIAREKL